MPETVGFCTCEPGLPMRDCGIPGHRVVASHLRHSAAPAPSPAAEPPHDLRDGLARTLYERDDAAEFTTWAQLPDWNRRMWLSDADALLAGPLAPLLARLTRAEAAVQRVEALMGDWSAVPVQYLTAALSPESVPS